MVASERGFTLVEVIVSAGLLATVAAGSSYLVARAVQDTEAVRTRTVAAVAAQQKMEQLRSLAWAGAQDFGTDLSGENAPQGGTGLQVSPAGTLDANVSGHVDYLSADGQWMNPASASTAVFARRWAIEAHGGDPGTLVLRVVVTRASGPMSRTAAQAGLYDVELVTLRTRYQP
jgi:prepilin-type N-terminal cleavage/methylation domain-containing protein